MKPTFDSVSPANASRHLTETQDYAERVYAGVLGKTIGVMMGKPFEGWEPELIEERFGQIDGYVHSEVDYPLICTDDDTSGTFTFVRALEDWGYPDPIEPWQIGRSWLNYLVEGRSVLWWGGIGASSEHTAYLRLQSGIDAPDSGSAKLNGKRVAEQIGAQIFVDGWAMLCPGDPEKAADLATRAGSVSHDGEAIHAARVIAAMEALAFVEPRMDRLVSEALRLIPADSVISDIVCEVAEWATQGDWRETRQRVAEQFGAHLYGVGHVIPNHALIHLALWHGGGDFAKSLGIVNSCGWDTDCNSGNVGCLLGIRSSLAGIPARLRDPIADRLYLPTADSGRGITDCLREACALVNYARSMRGQGPFELKSGARFHFGLPGAVQGFQGADLSNPNGALEIAFKGRSLTVTTPTFIPPDLGDMHGYELMASPTLYSGQHVVAKVTSDIAVEVALVARFYGGEARSDWQAPGVVEWTVPDFGGHPIYEVGIEIQGDLSGTVTLDSLDWSGSPAVSLLAGSLPPQAKSIWVQSTDELILGEHAPLILVQNRGTGMALTGCREWVGYAVRTKLTPSTGGRFGVAMHVQGLRRYFGVLIDTAGMADLVECVDEMSVLASSPVDVKPGTPVMVRLYADGHRLVAQIGDCRLSAEHSGRLASGGIAIIAESTRLEVNEIHVRPSADREVSWA